MKNITGCEYAQKIKSSKQDKNLEPHISGCAECQEAQKISGWMRKFAAQTQPPQNLPAPGFLLFKARLLQKQTAAAQAVQPIFWMQIAALFLLVLTGGWLALKAETLFGSILQETFSSLLSAAPFFILGVIGAVVICFGFNYLLHKRSE
ncbi:MAG TPA: hypothetical protein VK892_18675 [Pyrinomonadaceae bacterium]|nr:hypothetical protein [Pyrinomonadaceae bacterium]